ncbi:MAG: NHL repeat-containing protein [Coriobacteriia bacterium]|nr:NHL repeat-containing protein [Coriobacteriia bacterium]
MTPDGSPDTNDEAAKERSSALERAEERRRQRRREERAGRSRRLRERWPLGVAIVFVLLAAGMAAIAWREGVTPPPDPTASTRVRAPVVIRSIAPTGAGALRQPTGIAVSGDRVYVADPALGVVMSFTREGGRVATIGAGDLKTPVYVAVGPVDGRLYVSDRGLQKVLVFSTDGERIGEVLPQGNGAAPQDTKRPWKPLALAFGTDGRLYVADVDSDQRIAVFSPTGVRQGSQGDGLPIGRSGRRLAFPNGLVPTSHGLVVADSNNGRLLYLDGEARLVRSVKLTGLPRGAAPLPKGYIAVVDSSAHAVRVFDSTGRQVAAAGGYGAAEGRFAYPAGVATDPEGRVYVADSGNARVQIIRIPGVTAPEPGGLARSWPWLTGSATALITAIILAAWAYTRSRSPRRANTRTSAL